MTTEGAALPGKPETLRQKQSRFALDCARLILYAHEQGYEVTFGETYRTPEQAALNVSRGTGIANSLHTLRLAVDLNLFKDGEYLMETQPYGLLGGWWEMLGSDYCWGGRFTKQDGNHFSISHEGRK